MTVADIQKITIATVCIYRDSDFGYEDVFEGAESHIPEELLNAQVEAVSAARSGLLDIKIARQMPSLNK